MLHNLYRYSDIARGDVVNIFEKLKNENRVWLPHQVAAEYLKGRVKIINSQAATYPATLKKLRALKSEFDNNKQHPFLSESTKQRLEALFEEISTELKKGEETHRARFHMAPILDALKSIFSDSIGSPYSTF